MSVFLDMVSWIALVAGAIFCIIGGIGLIRLPDFYSRLHGGGITDTLGAGLVLLGLMIQAGFTLVAVKLIMLFAFSLIAGPTAVHALAKAAYRSGVKPLLHDEEAGESN